MPEKKSQHFVSQFYLRNFSPDTSITVGDRKTINVFNLKLGRTITNAGLKKQCCRDYFYGKDGVIENNFGKQEGIAAAVFRRIIASHALPAYDSSDHRLLVLFSHLQVFRTEQAARKLKETDDKVNAEIMSMDASDEAKAKVLIERKNHVNASLRYSSRQFPLLMDLECKLLIAGAGLEFLTSDNPVVPYNQLFESWSDGSRTALASVGLQLFYPLSPKLMFVMFDSKVYHFGRQGERTIHVSERKDVRALNSLQVVSANSNLYFQSSACEPFVAFQQGKPFIRKELGKVIAIPETYDDGRTGKLIGLTSVDVKTNLKLSFVSTKRAGREFMGRFNAAPVKPVMVLRNEQLKKEHDWLLKEIDAGRLTGSDFHRVLGRHFFGA